MSDQHLELSGEVSSVEKGKFKIKLENGNEILAQISGKLRLNKIRILLGDKVKVKVSIYDLNNGIIISRI